MFDNRIIILYSIMIIIIIFLLLNLQRCVAHNDFVMCLTYLFFLSISYLFSFYTYAYYIILKKTL